MYCHGFVQKIEFDEYFTLTSEHNIMYVLVYNIIVQRQYLFTFTVIITTE